ncbi:MAG: divalent-cation tolerance protein CutA [Calditrichaeota bacterium]|nr:divalent-cation tolerance protein CutA [Calditrichota bacterium]
MTRERSNFIIVLTTFSSEEEAESIIQQALDEKLIACANIIPQVNSFFHWKGQISNEKESMAVMKSRHKLFSELKDLITRLHSYDIPEIIALPIVDGSEEYLTWLQNETKD